MAAEKNFENKVKKYLDQQGAWYIKYWAGSKFTKEGIPDILACVNGRFYGIEDKGPNGRPKVLQLINLRKIREAGGFGILLYPKDFNYFIEFTKCPGPNNLWYRENIKLQEKWFKKLTG